MLLGTGPLERDEENTRSFSIRLEAVDPNGGVFGEVFFFPFWGHQKQERWETKLGCSSFLGKKAEKVEQVEKVKKKRWRIWRCYLL